MATFFYGEKEHWMKSFEWINELLLYILIKRGYSNPEEDVADASSGWIDPPPEWVTTRGWPSDFNCFLLGS